MQIEAAERNLERARADYAHATRAAFNAETLASQKRHSRRAQVAATRIRDFVRDVARLNCDREELHAYLSA